MDLLETFLYNLDIISPFCVLVFLLSRKPKLEGAFLWFILFVSSIFLFSLSAMLIVKLPKLLHSKKTFDNLRIYHLGCIAYVVTLFKFFSEIITSKTAKIIDILFLIPFVILSIYNFIYLTRTFTIYGLTSMWVSIKCLLYYAQKINNPAVEDILKSPTFWIISGLFLYFSSAFFIFISFDFFTAGILKGVFSPMIADTWLLGNIILSVSCAFYIKAIRCKQ